MHPPCPLAQGRLTSACCARPQRRLRQQRRANCVRVHVSGVPRGAAVWDDQRHYGCCSGAPLVMIYRVSRCYREPTYPSLSYNTGAAPCRENPVLTRSSPAICSGSRGAPAAALRHAAPLWRAMTRSSLGRSTATRRTGCGARTLHRCNPATAARCPRPGAPGAHAQGADTTQDLSSRGARACSQVLDTLVAIQQLTPAAADGARARFDKLRAALGAAAARQRDLQAAALQLQVQAAVSRGGWGGPGAPREG